MAKAAEFLKSHELSNGKLGAMTLKTLNWPGNEPWRFSKSKWISIFYKNDSG